MPLTATSADEGVAETPPAPAASVGHIWLLGTFASAITITALDAVILQHRKSFFTGGFLAATHATSTLEAAGFLVISLLVDASVLGVLAALVLWLTSRLRLTRTARLSLVAFVAMVPIVLWDIIAYSLVRYLGDAFDFGLMFDLTGRSPGEVLAVSSAHLAAPVGLAAALVGGVAGFVWMVNRFGGTTDRTTALRPRGPLARAFLLAAVGLVTCTAASTSSDLAEDGLRRKASGQIYLWLASNATDFDGDGFGMGGRNSDPAPFNATIYPYALDVPGNGIDENGVGGDLPVGPAYTEAAPAASVWAARPPVVLVVLESFRADAVGRVVNGVPVTPVLDRLAREGASSPRAYSHNGYTTQSRFHLFTGSLAGLRAGSIVDDFKAQGYEVAYFSAQDESFGGDELGVGFDRADVSYDARQDRDRRYSTYTTAGSLAVSHRTLHERVEGFLGRRDGSRPLFLYVNYHDTHFPYHHREMEPLLSKTVVPQRSISPSYKEAVQEMYYNAAANVDRALGATLASVTRALGKPPAVIVTADHGESLFDQGFLGHGYALNEIQTRIPLIVRGLPMEIHEPFGQIDLRDAITVALSRPEALGQDAAIVRPTVIRDPGKPVFQYLGNVRRPRQIAFTSVVGRLAYDFRDRRVTLPDGTSHAPETLSGDDRARFFQLVQFWERMMIARAAGARAGEE